MSQETPTPDRARRTEDPDDPGSSHLKTVVKGLGLTLLGAAAALPVLCLYLTRRVLRRDQRLLDRRRSMTDRPERGSKPVRIPITLSVEEAPQETESPEELETGDVKEATPESRAKYVASTESDKFHLPMCRWARQIRGSHRIELSDREEALAQGLEPCKTCNP